MFSSPWLWRRLSSWTLTRWGSSSCWEDVCAIWKPQSHLDQIFSTAVTTQDPVHVNCWVCLLSDCPSWSERAKGFRSGGGAIRLHTVLWQPQRDGGLPLLENGILGLAFGSQKIPHQVQVKPMTNACVSQLCLSYIPYSTLGRNLTVHHQQSTMNLSNELSWFHSLMVNTSLITVFVPQKNHIMGCKEWIRNCF